MIEVLEPNGVWSAFSGRNNESDIGPSLPRNTNIIDHTEDPGISMDLVHSSRLSLERFSPFDDFQIPQDGVSSHFNSVHLATPQGPPFSPGIFGTLSARQFSIPRSPTADNNPFIASSFFETSPFFHLQANATVVFKTYNDTTYQWNEERQNQDGILLRRTETQGLVGSLCQYASEILHCASAIHPNSDVPDAGVILESLESLLPSNLDQGDVGSRLVPSTTDVIFNSPFHKAFIYSILNGFAGVQSLPLGSILKMLRSDLRISTRIFRYIQSNSFPCAKSLAENIFKAAIEDGDAQTVSIILEETSHTPNAIDPNEIVCQFQGRDYTPIELAAKFRNLEVVTLLAAQSDVNKTYATKDYEGRGALELAIRKGHRVEPIDLRIVQTILDRGAEIHADLAESVACSGYRDIALFEEFFWRRLPDTHKICFHSTTILEDIVKYMDNRVAASTIRGILTACQQSNCTGCHFEHPRVAACALVQASLKANLELIKLMLNFTPERDLPLAAAVRSGSREAVDILIEHRAGFNCPARPFYVFFDRSEDEHDIYRPCVTTPLAEAIRLKDHSLIRLLEDLGEWFYLNQGGRFEASITAAAETNNIAYMHKLLQRIPSIRGPHLTSALSMAILKQNTEAALLLFDSGVHVYREECAPLSPFGSPITTNNALEFALKMMNKTVVNALLEYDSSMDHSFSSAMADCVLVYAVKWGDIETIADLISMGADVNRGRKKTGLMAAIESKNSIVINFLLENGADPNKAVSDDDGRHRQMRNSNHSLRPIALATNDYEIMRMLVSKGADPANEDAFILVIEHDYVSLNTLLGVFSTIYPEGRKGFGANVLKKAIVMEDDALLQKLFEAKFDVNSFSTFGGFNINDNDTNKYGESVQLATTPLCFGIRQRRSNIIDLVQKLLKAGADADSLGSRYRPIYEMPFFCNTFAPLETALQAAIQTGNKQLVQLLLDKGADVNRLARRGTKRTPLQQACEIGSYKIVELLLERGAEVNDVPALVGGGTALTMAAISGSIKIVLLLLNKNAFVHGPRSRMKGRSPFEAAAEYGRLDVLKTLWDAAFGRGFNSEEIETATSLAKSKGHRGCAEYIGYLALTSYEASSRGISFETSGQGMNFP